MPPQSSSADLDRLLRDFVEAYGGVRQHGAEWYALMGETVGGSELSAIMGHNPYNRISDIIFRKLAPEGGSGFPACWWGTLFENVFRAFIETDLGASVRGGDICIQTFPGHRNSPDGYIVAQLYRGKDGAFHLWTTDTPAAPTVPRILLLELKCPVSRKPAAPQRVPRQYVPQLWSGLAVSPVAHAGLYADAFFRKCGLYDFGDTPAYDAAYHKYDRDNWGHPIAWGLIAVYAPLSPQSDAALRSNAEAARQISSMYFGLEGCGVADLGDMEAHLFHRALGLIDQGAFPIARGEACFADGRGAALHSGRDVEQAIELFRENAPERHWLLGVLPWKLFEVDYTPVYRRPGFMDEMAPLIAKVHQTVKAARAAANPLAYLQELGLTPPPPPRSTAKDIQEFFDATVV